MRVEVGEDGGEEFGDEEDGVGWRAWSCFRSIFRDRDSRAHGRHVAGRRRGIHSGISVCLPAVGVHGTPNISAVAVTVVEAVSQQ